MVSANYAARPASNRYTLDSGLAKIVIISFNPDPLVACCFHHLDFAMAKRVGINWYSSQGILEVMYYMTPQKTVLASFIS